MLAMSLIIRKGTINTIKEKYKLTLDYCNFIGKKEYSEEKIVTLFQLDLIQRKMDKEKIERWMKKYYSLPNIVTLNWASANVPGQEKIPNH
jgi:hypothetical protein